MDNAPYAAPQTHLRIDRRRGARGPGYKIYERYKTCGLEGLNDRSRRPYRHANKLPYQVERTILGIKKEHPSWGAPKIRDKLIREFPRDRHDWRPALDSLKAMMRPVVRPRAIEAEA